MVGKKSFQWLEDLPMVGKNAVTASLKLSNDWKKRTKKFQRLEEPLWPFFIFILVFWSAFSYSSSITDDSPEGSMCLMRIYLCLFVLLSFFVSLAWSNQTPELDELARLRSQVGALSNGYYTEETWQTLMDEFESVRAQADAEKDWTKAVNTGLLQAHSYRELRNDDNRALALLEKLKVVYGSYSAAPMREVYMQQAAIYEVQNNPQGIAKLIYEFKKCPQYDGEAFSYSGSGARGDALAITRPHAKGSDSLTITAMQKMRKQALLGQGERVPALELKAVNGSVYTLDRLPWKVTLIDFWMNRWAPWQRELPYLLNVFETYAPKGFGLIGVCLDTDAEAGLAYFKGRGATWPVALDPRGTTARSFGLYGEAGNLLVDEHGFIIARNVRGADLAAEVRRALGLEEGRIIP